MENPSSSNVLLKFSLFLTFIAIALVSTVTNAVLYYSNIDLYQKVSAQSSLSNRTISVITSEIGNILLIIYSFIELSRIN